MISVNTNVWASHAAVTLPPAHPSDSRRTRAMSWWGMTLLVAGLLGVWVVMGVGWGVSLGLLVGLWLWAGHIDKKGGLSKSLAE